MPVGKIIKRSRFGALQSLIPLFDENDLWITNTGLAFEIPGGDKGVVITRMQVSPLRSTVKADNDICGCRLIVFNGKCPDDITELLQTNVDNGMPLESSFGLPFELLYSTTYDDVRNNLGGGFKRLKTDDINFSDGMGPGVGAGETITALLYPVPYDVTNEESDSHIGFMSLSVHGNLFTGVSEDMGRSIPRGRI